MSIFSRLIRSMLPGLAVKRAWTVGEIRALIERGEYAAAEHATKVFVETTADNEVIGYCFYGELAFLQHHDEDAEQCFNQALEAQPGLGAAHYGLSLLLHARGDLQSALRHAHFATNGDRGEARFYAQLGLCQLELSNYARAEVALTQATRLAPNDKMSWNNLGISRRARGHYSAAAVCFQRALEIDPDFTKAAANAAQLVEDAAAVGADKARLAPSSVDVGDTDNTKIAHIRSLEVGGDPSAAIDACERYCNDDPDDASLVIELARLYCGNGDTQSGLDVLRAFRVRHPGNIEIMAVLGVAYAEAHQPVAAEPLLAKALEQRPEDINVLRALAGVREEQGRIAEAGELLDRAVTLRPSIELKCHLTASLVARCRYDEALTMIDNLLAEHPSAEGDLVGFQVFALTALGRHDEALPILDRAIEQSPNDPNKRFPRATMHLLNERYAAGWEDYRFRNLAATKQLRMLPFPEWRGESLEGKSVVVLAEQGLGDQVMFASCLPDLLAQKPSRVVVEVIDRVAPTIARSFPQCEVISTKQDRELAWVRDIGTMDCFVAMGDLPEYFRRDRADFPQHHGYLKADPDRVAHWRHKLDACGARPRIGLSWRGGTESTRSVLRTMDVTMLRPFAEACDATWVCLQYGDVTDDLAKAREAGLHMEYWSESIKHLDEFAALIGALDLVVTVCNTTVHYAGALGMPVWVMAPQVPEWRYGLRSSSLPWYPSSRIYRQQDWGDWTALLKLVQHNLSLQFGAQ